MKKFRRLSNETIDRPSASKPSIEMRKKIAVGSGVLDVSDTVTIKRYFEQISRLMESKEEYPIDLDDVWPLVYGKKSDAVSALKGEFIEKVDYVFVRQNPQQRNPTSSRKSNRGGSNRVTYKITLKCFEFFIARKVRPVFEVYREVLHQRIKEEKNPDLIVDRAIDTYKRRGKTDAWIQKRLKGKATRNQFTAVLKSHGVEQEGYRNATNALYSPLYGGSTNVVREKKGISKKESIRDNLSDLELSAIDLAEQLAIELITKDNLEGNAQCELATKRASISVAQAVRNIKSK